MAIRSLQDLLNAQEDEEAMMTPMEVSPLRSNMSEIPPAQPDMQQPVIPDDTPQEQVFNTPQLSDIIPPNQEPQVPMMADAGITPPVPETPLSKSQQLIAEYQKMLGKDTEDLAAARKSDRMLKAGGAIGDALATYLNAKGQMNVKAPGVQVQQGAGLGKIADMFATAPEIASDVKGRQEAMLKQYAELAKGERSASDRALQERKIAAYEAQTKAQADRLKAQEDKAAKKESEPTFEEKESIKADVKEQKQIAKENRDVERKLEPAIDSIEKQLKNVDNALKLFIDEKTGEIKSGLTGPARQFISPYLEKGQKVENALNKISLSEMTQMFQGMSKAIDSDAERAFFQSAQPALKKYETVNVEVLREMKEKLESLRDKSKNKLQELKGIKQNYKVGTILRSGEKRYRVVDEQGNVEEVK
jgi:hypothetical protein